MSGFHQQHFAGMGPRGTSRDPNARAFQESPTNPYQAIEYLTEFSPPFSAPPSNPASGRSRKKTAPGAETIKHRRTRSGCYTCRSRRVKCDEQRPVCERCRKGKRACTYPDSNAPSRATSSGASKSATTGSHATSPASSNDEAEDTAESDHILDDVSRSQGFGQSTPLWETPPPPPTLDYNMLSTLFGITGSGATQPSFAYLPPELQHFMNFYQQDIDHLHYGIVSDTHEFFSKMLPYAAIQTGNESLLYALVGFAAYKSTIQNPDGKVETFLPYYNRSVTLLLESLARSEQPGLPLLLTILQLATIEDYLGDWVTVISHQKAAYELVTRLLNPQAAAQHPATRVIVDWYRRLDLYTGIRSGLGFSLPRPWIQHQVEVISAQSAADPSNLAYKIETQKMTLKLLSIDMANLYAEIRHGLITAEDFADEHSALTKNLKEWKDNIDPALVSPSHLVDETQLGGPLSGGEILFPYRPGYLFKQPLFPTTLLLAEWHGLMVWHGSQEALILGRDPSTRVAELARTACEICESITRYHAIPNTALLSLQHSFGISSLFLPKDNAHSMWIKRVFTYMESSGMIVPLMLRRRLAEVLHDPTTMNWWLPNGEGLTPVMRSIRSFSDERNTSELTQQPQLLLDMCLSLTKMAIS